MVCHGDKNIHLHRCVRWHAYWLCSFLAMRCFVCPDRRFVQLGYWKGCVHHSKQAITSLGVKRYALVTIRYVPRYLVHDTIRFTIRFTLYNVPVSARKQTNGGLRAGAPGAPAATICAVMMRSGDNMAATTELVGGVFLCWFPLFCWNIRLFICQNLLSVSNFNNYYICIISYRHISKRIAIRIASL